MMTAIRESENTYPIIMSLHLTCIALFGGMIVITDLRLLGWAFQNRPVADVIDGLRWWKRAGFVIMASMGILLWGSKAEEYYPNPYFWAKMSLLALVLIHAIVFRPRVYNHPERFDISPSLPTRARMAGALSLILWTCVLCAGRLIGYYEPPRDQGQSVVNPYSHAFSGTDYSNAAQMSRLADTSRRVNR
jgi:hypothetical protein